ncbi:hypothetical protein D3C73_840090 [compost metagenome]
MFLILWNLIGFILLISILFILINLLWERRSEQVKLPFARRKPSHEERRSL